MATHHGYRLALEHGSYTFGQKVLEKTPVTPFDQGYREPNYLKLNHTSLNEVQQRKNTKP